MLVRFTKGWLRDITPENLLGYSFIIKGKGRGRRTLSSSRRRSASIISSSRLSSGIFLSLHGQARSTNYCVCVCVCVCVCFMCAEIINYWAHWTGCGHATIVLFLGGFVAKQACLVLWLSKPVFMSNHQITRLVAQLVKNPPCNVGDLGSNPGVGKIPWRRERLLTPVFWPGEFHGLYSPWGHKESDTNERLSLSPPTHTHPFIFYLQSLVGWLFNHLLCPFILSLSN